MIPFYDGNAYPAKLLDKHGGPGYAASIDVNKPISVWYPPTGKVSLIWLALGVGFLALGVVFIWAHLASGAELIDDDMFLEVSSTYRQAGMGSIAMGIMVLGILAFRFFGRCRLRRGEVVPGFPYDPVDIARVTEVRREYGKAAAGGIPSHFSIHWSPDPQRRETESGIGTGSRMALAGPFFSCFQLRNIRLPATEKAEELVKAIEVAMKLHREPQSPA